MFFWGFILRPNRTLPVLSLMRLFENLLEIEDGFILEERRGREGKSDTLWVHSAHPARRAELRFRQIDKKHEHVEETQT